MTIQESIQQRRTIKPLHFTGEKIEDKDIQEMLDCANWAPSHKLTEPWRFVVFSENAKTQFGIDHAEMYKKVKSDAFEQKKYDKLMTIADKSSHIIAIIMQRDAAERIREIEEVAAVACAVQNMMLVATEKGIANIWGSGGMTYHPLMKEYLGFGEKDKVMGFLYVGKSDLKPKSKRFISIEDKTVWKK